jgi:two-component system, chemotaxis family, CheB/CheR fusion protein
MAISGGLLRLQSRNPAQGKHMPVDVLFHSLAEDQGPNAIGVVLSGGGSDGALGLQEIKGAGGITFAQDEASARFTTMPRAAIGLGCVDFILAPAEIAQEIARIARHPYLNGIEPEVGESPPAGEPELKRIFHLLFVVGGMDFSHYKRSTVQRRMARRMALHKLDALPDYLTFLEGNPNEVKSLAEDLLVRVTGFFRDAETFEGITQTVFPPLLEGRSPKDPVRIWVPGCASGEEVYSIAICLLEYLGGRATAVPLQIFGTDVSEAAIEQARAGLYIENIAREVSSERLQRFFVKTDAHYQIAKSIRDLCVFARQDVTRDPPFSKLDLVSCRNLLIYLDPLLQKRIILLFHYALKPGGFLVLGSAETIGPFSDLFHLLDKKLKLYTQKPLPGRPHFEFIEGHHAPRRADHPKGVIEPAPSLPDAERLQREADRLLLARYAPAGVLVDEVLNILQFRGETGAYLTHPPGPATLNLKKLARPGLLVALGAALAQVKQDGVPVRKAGLPLEIEGRRREINLEVIPVKAAPGENRYYLILFEEAVPTLPPAGRPRPLAALWAKLTGAARSGDRPAHADQGAGEVLQLKGALEATRDYIQRMIEEHEAAQEELKSTQEELLSSNEEFQSTNEELETAKEELQSVNEELSTTNEELRQRNRELFEVNEALTQARDYVEAIVETMRQPLLVLDGDLRVLRANRSFYQVFQTTPEKTENAFIYGLGNREWDLPALRQMLEEILPQDLAFQDYEVTQVFPAIGEKTMRLNACRLEWKGRTPALILLAIEDITERKAAMELEILKETNRHKDTFLAMISHELRNPLAPLRTGLQILRRTDIDEATVRSQQAIMDRQLTKISRLVDDLLDVALIVRGQITLNQQPIDLGSIVSQAVTDLRDPIEASGKTLRVSLPATPLWVEGDPFRLEQVVSNLLHNAAKYTDKGATIRLTLEGQDHEGVLTITDNGLGIAPAILPRIFDLFVQADTSLDHSQGGLGIGLTLVCAVVESHGGRVEAKSPGLGQGSEFSVRLPLLPETPTTLKAQPTPESLEQPSASRRILVVDDNQDSVDSLAFLLQIWGHTVEIAYDPSSALETARTFRPEIALLDIGLPGMTGLDLAQRLRSLPGLANLYLVAVTGYGRKEDWQATRAAGFHCHVVKPVDAEALKTLIASFEVTPEAGV